MACISRSHPGSFTLLLGCGGSGKTTKLFQLLHSHAQEGKRCALFHGKGFHSHFLQPSSLAMLQECVEVQEELNPELLSRYHHREIRVIGMDEAQCMVGCAAFWEEALTYGMHLIVTMRKDTEQPNLAEAIALATDIQCQSGICEQCQKPAQFSTPEYTALCLYCFQLEKDRKRTRAHIRLQLHGWLFDTEVVLGETDSLAGLTHTTKELGEWWDCVMSASLWRDIQRGIRGTKFTGRLKSLAKELASEVQEKSTDSPPALYNVTIQMKKQTPLSERVVYVVDYYYREQ